MLIVGGHTVDDEEPKYGLSVTGVVKPGKEVTNAGSTAGRQACSNQADWHWES